MKFIALISLLLVMIPTRINKNSTKSFMKDEFINGRPVLIYHGEKQAPGRNILVLPGWNFSRKSWLDHTRLRDFALKHKFRLILPEMGKSIYASNIFPETRKDWLSYPMMSFITDSLLPHFQEQGILLPGQENYILGLSTGARGAVLVAMKLPRVFRAGAGFSGDYDQSLMPTDNLCKGFYGPIEQFRERWQQVDNPAYLADSLKTPFYLSHGKNDKVVSWEQTRVMGKMLAVKNPALAVRIHINDTAGHNYGFWDAELDSAFSFFSRF